MTLPNLTGTGRLTADPELAFAASGTPHATISLAFNSRRKNEQGEWVNDKVFFIRGKLFHQAAENAAESLTKGTEVIVTGRLQTDQWDDRETGQKRSAPALMIDSIGPSIRTATARVHKAERSASAAPGDSWSTAPASAGGGFPDDPPF